MANFDAAMLASHGFGGRCVLHCPEKPANEKWRADSLKVPYPSMFGTTKFEELFLEARRQSDAMLRELRWRSLPLAVVALTQLSECVHTDLDNNGMLEQVGDSTISILSDEDSNERTISILSEEDYNEASSCGMQQEASFGKMLGQTISL